MEATNIVAPTVAQPLVAAVAVTLAAERLGALEWVIEQIEDAWVKDLDSRLLIAARGCIESARDLLEKATAAIDGSGVKT